MSLVSVKEPTEFMQCPFDPSHVVSAIRYTRHIVKCQRNHPSVVLVSCPFNHQHRYRQEENAQHLTTCPDRISVERDFFTPMSLQANGGNVAVPIQEPHVEADEDWDNVAEGPAYNPALKMNKLQFLNPSVTAYLKPAEKRAYRQQLQTRGFSQDDFICQRDEDEDEVKLVPLVNRHYQVEKTAGLSRTPIRPAASTSHTSGTITTSKSPSATSRSAEVELRTLVREQVLNTTCQPSYSQVSRGIGRGARSVETSTPVSRGIGRGARSVETSTPVGRGIGRGARKIES